jgi:glycosyl transferase family 87
MTDFLAEARWLNGTRVVIYPRLFIAVYAIAIAWMLAASPHLIDPFGKPIGTDFMNFWAAGRLTLGGEPAAAYDYARHFAVEHDALPWPSGQAVPYFAWCYPPMFLLVAAAFALLPYGIALFLWVVVTLPAYLATIRAIMPGRQAFMAALAFPAVFVNLGHGQNGFLTAGLLGGGLLLLDRRPALAGLLLGLLAYKPQLGLLLPLVLLIGGHWRAMAVAGLSVIAMVSISWALLGSETWHAFFASLPLTKSFILEQGASGWPTLQSTFAAVRQLGGSIAAAYAAQAGVTALTTLAVAWVWWQPVDQALKNAALVTATVMVTPYVLDYDLIVLALPIAWLSVVGLRQGFLAWEKIGLLAAWMLPLLSRVIGLKLGLPTAPIVLALLLALIVRRVVASVGEKSASSQHVPRVQGPA